MNTGNGQVVEVIIDDEAVTVSEQATVLDACRARGVDTPTLCFLDTLTPVSTCRVCVVEVESSRALVPACSRRVEEGMVVHTDTPRVRHSRRLVFELLGSSVDLSLLGGAEADWMTHYRASPDRFGPRGEAAEAGERDERWPGHHPPPAPDVAETVAEPVRIDNDLYIRDYEKCILCYKCVEACGVDAQNTFAIAVAGRGFDARISTEFAVPLPQSACVYCGNCIGVCPTGALMFKSEYDMRESSAWDESRQSITQTICAFCGVGCNLELHVQDNAIVKVTSPLDHDITSGHLCIKGRFGYQHVQTHQEPT